MTPYYISSVTKKSRLPSQELGLAADRDIKKVVDYKSHTQHDDVAKQTIELQPFQIRTFILNFNSTETTF